MGLDLNISLDLSVGGIIVKKISLPHLYKLLMEIAPNIFENLRPIIRAKLMEWPEMAVIQLERDISLVEIEKIDEGDWEKLQKLEVVPTGLSYSTFQHVDLIWKFRNRIIHEMEKPGYGIEGDGDRDFPYYHVMGHGGDIVSDDRNLIDDIEDGTITWELVYPLDFVEMIARSGADNLRKYCISEQIRPHDSYVFGTFWWDFLNQDS